MKKKETKKDRRLATPWSRSSTRSISARIRIVRKKGHRRLRTSTRTRRVDTNSVHNRWYLDSAPRCIKSSNFIPCDSSGTQKKLLPLTRFHCISFSRLS
jgi:hypothetical protein